MTSTPLLTIASPAQAELIEKKSRFIGSIAPAQDEAEALAFLEQIRLQHKTASHHCYAWICGEYDSSQRSSDAGEPSGTAGRPILEAIKHAELHNTVIVVTRYFGGILLGAGGLTRAYGKTAQLAIEQANPMWRVPARRCALNMDYALLGKVEGVLAQHQITVENKLFAEQVCFICVADDETLELAERELIELSNGSLSWQDLGESLFIYKPVC